MCSPLRSTLANIIMTAFEEEIVEQLAKFNSYQLQTQFTLDDFPDNDVHFLHIKITSDCTRIFRKQTHTGQYSHIPSFSPWLRKTAWIRALILHAKYAAQNLL